MFAKFPVILVLLAFSGHPALAGDVEKEQPNIVVFVSDDHGYFDSGCYGHPVVKTPNIDKLAEQSMRFIHAFAEAPLCSPSRSSIHTGVIPLKNGGAVFDAPIHEGIKTLPEYMKGYGYHTALIGKSHCRIRAGDETRPLPYDDLDGAGGQQLDRSALVGKTAAAYISNYQHDKPLFLFVGTYPPHLPWVPNKDYDEKNVHLPPHFLDTRVTRQERTRYYQDITLMDSMLGEVRDAISKRAWNENTVFLYTSDHGANWPFAKWTVYDGGLRVPFIVHVPGVTNHASLSDAILQHCDIAATCVELAGGRAPDAMDGRSFAGVLDGRTKQHRQFAFGSHSTCHLEKSPQLSTNGPARTIRSDRYRYILNLEHKTRITNYLTGTTGGMFHLEAWTSWLKKAEKDGQAQRVVNRYLHRRQEELYDLDSDPYEMNNLAGSVEHQEELQSLRGALKAFCTEIEDRKALDHLVLRAAD